MNQFSRIQIYLFSAACLSQATSAGSCRLTFGPAEPGQGPKKQRPVTPALSRGCVARASTIQVESLGRVLGSEKHYNFSNKRRAKTNGHYWSGETTQGAEFSIFEAPDGTKMGSLVDQETNEITQFRESADGGWYAETIDVEDFPEEADCIEPDRRHLHEAPESSKELQVHGLRGYNTKQHAERDLQTNTVFDVLVVWTKKAECANSATCTNGNPTQNSMDQMFNRINLAVQETNDAYTLSGINAELRLVHAYRHPDYAETSVGASSVFHHALYAAQNPSDGIMDDVTVKRNQYGADIVVVIIDDGAYCGLGFIGPSSSYMFSATAWNCATGYYSFGHEIGHNQGCRHDRGTDNACTDSNYYYGYRDPQASFRSILAYNCATGQCDNIASSGCTRVKRFSNTNSQYNGKDIGNAGADNARQINEVRATVAGFKATTTDCSNGMTCLHATGECVCDTAPACVTDDDCGDGDQCDGIERCVSGTCVEGTALVCDDNNLCNGIETCSPTVGCLPGTPLSCDDGNACNGIETCNATIGCVAGTPMVCNDGDPCNGVETCDPGSDQCLQGIPLSCDDNDVCNGAETCVEGVGCVAGIPLTCDDGVACNGVETCHAVTGCVPPVTCPPCQCSDFTGPTECKSGCNNSCSWKKGVCS